MWCRERSSTLLILVVNQFGRTASPLVALRAFGGGHGRRQVADEVVGPLLDLFVGHG
jgi:hypothetical protein